MLNSDSPVRSLLHARRNSVRAPVYVADGWLVQTKLRPPLPNADVIPRPRLLLALGEALRSRRLTLVSAPAGYGKTTLLASLADVPLDPSASSGQAPSASSGQAPSSFDRLSPSAGLRLQMRSARNLPVAWLSLDEEDNDPARFLASLAAALRRLSPACGATAQTLLDGRAGPRRLTDPPSSASRAGQPACGCWPTHCTAFPPPPLAVP